MGETAVIHSVLSYNNRLVNGDLRVLARLNGSASISVNNVTLPRVASQLSMLSATQSNSACPSLGGLAK